MATLAPKLPYLHPFAGGYPGRGGQYLPTDADAVDYLNRVAAADGASVEVGIAQAIEAFIVGCKADSAGYAGDPTRSNWDAIQASCIMCGARTLSGALVPLKRPYGPDLVDIDALPTPTITDSGGSTGVWTPSTRTLSSSTTGTSDTFPRFAFPVGMTIGRRYKVSLTLNLSVSGCLKYVRIGSATLISGVSAVDSFVIDEVYTCTGTTDFQIDLNATVPGASVTIESLSIREDSFTPTSYNFASGDYSRSGTPGIKGDGSTKYLDTGRASDADGQDDHHLAVYKSAAGDTLTKWYAGTAESVRPSFSLIGEDGAYSRTNVRLGTFSNSASTGLFGVSRQSSSTASYIRLGVVTSVSATSYSPDDTRNNFVFGRNDPVGAVGLSNARLAFYSVGAALDLAALDTRTTNLVNGIKFHSLTGLLPNDYDPDTIAYIVAAYEAGGTL